VLPVAKRQPNLLFAAARYLLDAPADIHTLRGLVRELAAVMRARSTQTNEAARCATLLPALVGLAEPLALLDVGAAAGLTLLLDPYSYNYAGHHLPGADPQAPTLTCQPQGPVPLPERLPTVAWRAGLDLNPLDAANPDDAQWLECLLWPGEGDREARLRDALAVARRLQASNHPCTAGTLSTTSLGSRRAPRPTPHWSSTTPQCSSTSTPTGAGPSD
jgi:hypothetical protein